VGRRRCDVSRKVGQSVCFDFCARLLGFYLSCPFLSCPLSGSVSRTLTHIHHTHIHVCVWCMCVYVCVYAFICIHTCACACVCVFLCMHACAFIIDYWSVVVWVDEYGDQSCAKNRWCVWCQHATGGWVDHVGLAVRDRQADGSAREAQSGSGLPNPHDGWLHCWRARIHILRLVRLLLALWPSLALTSSLYLTRMDVWYHTSVCFMSLE